MVVRLVLLGTTLEVGVIGLVAHKAQPASIITIWVKRVVLAPLVEDQILKVLDSEVAIRMARLIIWCLTCSILAALPLNKLPKCPKVIN